MELNAHGGGCCGITHINSFGTANIETLRLYLRQHDLVGFGSRMLEAVLTDAQAQHWEAPLLNNGFVKVARFRNSNSGNFCNIYYRYVERPHDGYTVEFFGPVREVPVEVPAQAPDPVAPSVVLTEYFAELRTVGRRGPFPSVQEARRAFPRCGNFSVRSVMSDGSIREEAV